MSAFFILIPAMYALFALALGLIAIVDRQLIAARWAALGFFIAFVSISVDGYRTPEGYHWVAWFTVTGHFLALLVMVQAFLSRHGRYVPRSAVLVALLSAIYVMPAMPWAPPYTSRGLIVQAVGTVVILCGVPEMWRARHKSTVDLFAFGVLLAAGLSYAGRSVFLLLHPIGNRLEDVAAFLDGLNMVLHSASALMGMCVGIVLMMMIGHDMVRGRIEEGEVDALTGVGNRRRLERELEEDQRDPGRTGGVLVIDLDHFKRINDNFGHDAGDTVLRAVGAGLNAQFAGIGTICRTGGEEFVVLVPPAFCAEVAPLARATRAMIAGLSFTGALAQLRVTASIGLHLREEGAGLHETIRRADQAVYCAKTDGRDRVVQIVRENGLQLMRAVA
ncbi:MAG: GGDEF domain-containing protein [Erythrobacter sp.]|nr:GGDEF domain-containing protein [Erythrobacter sp.]